MELGSLLHVWNPRTGEAEGSWVQGLPGLYRARPCVKTNINSNPPKPNRKQTQQQLNHRQQQQRNQCRGQTDSSINTLSSQCCHCYPCARPWSGVLLQVTLRRCSCQWRRNIPLGDNFPSTPRHHPSNKHSGSCLCGSPQGIWIIGLYSLWLCLHRYDAIAVIIWDISTLISCDFRGSFISASASCHLFPFGYISWCVCH